MKTNDKIDAARIDLLLGELRLSGVRLIWATLAATADKEGWPAARFLAALAEQEMVERSRRRFERNLAEARLPPGKTLDTFDFDAVPMISKAQVKALAGGDAWLENGANLLCFGPPGGGKSHLAAALGFALIENGWRVLFARTTDLVQKLQIARRDLVLEAAIAKLDKYHLLIASSLDDANIPDRADAESRGATACRDCIREPRAASVATGRETPQERGPWPRGSTHAPPPREFRFCGSSLRIMDAPVQVIVENIAVRLTGKHP